MLETISNWKTRVQEAVEALRGGRKRKVIVHERGTSTDLRGDDVFRRHGIRPEEPPKRFGTAEPARLEIRRGPSRRDFQMRLAETDEGDVLHTKRRGRSGVEIDEGGDVVSEEHNTTFRPAKARGRAGSRDHGLYHELFLTSAQYQRSWNNIVQALTTGRWKVEPPDLPDTTPPSVRDEAERRCEAIERALFTHLEGGWRGFVREWLYALIAGFNCFETVFYPFGHEREGLVRDLAFIYPSSVESWVLTEDERRLQAVEFRPPNGQPYSLPADWLHIYSHNRFGQNYEGISTLRPLARWIQMLQMIQQLEALAYERFGTPWIAASRDSEAMPRDDESDDLGDILKAARAEESPVVPLPDGTSIEMVSASGELPPFDEAKRFIVEQIKQQLSAEGSLIAVGDTGAFAARESASKDVVKAAEYFGGLLCDNLNGASNLDHTGVVKTMEDARYGGPVRPGAYCQLSYSSGDFEDPEWTSRVNNSAAQGTVKVTPAVREEVHERLGLPVPENLENGQTPEAGATEADDLTDVDAREVAAAGGLHLRLADGADGLDPDKAASKQDRLEARLARQLRSVAVSMRDEWRDELRPLILQAREVDGGGDFVRERAEQLREEIEQKYQQRFREVAEDVLEEARQQGAKDLIRSTGRTVQQSADLDLPAGQFATGIEAAGIAREASNRQGGRLWDRTLELARGDDRISLPVLAESTFGQTAGKSVSGAYNTGRDSVVKKVREVGQRRGERPRLIAERSSVLDEDTCDPCEELNNERFLVGSGAYESHKPPLKCEGGGRCRCVYVYILPDEEGFGEAVEELKS